MFKSIDLKFINAFRTHVISTFLTVCKTYFYYFERKEKITIKSRLRKVIFLNISNEYRVKNVLILIIQCFAPELMLHEVIIIITTSQN